MATLKQIANGMRNALDLARQAGKPRAYMLRTLPPNLEVVYSYEGDVYRLAMRRENLPLATDEVDTLLTVFDVQDDCCRRAYVKNEAHPITGRKIKYNVVEVSWREIPAHGGHPLSFAMATGAPKEGPDSVLAPGG